MNPTVVGSLRSWTMWFAVLLAIIGFVQLQTGELSKLLSPQAMGWFNIITGAIVAGLRAITTMSLTEKGEQIINKDQP